MTEKADFRVEIKTRIAALSPAYLADSDSGILQNLAALPEFLSAPRVFLYISFGREPDTRALIALCQKREKQVAAPVNLDAGHMNFAVLTHALSALPKDIYGIPEPTAEAPRVMPKKGDLVVVPGLCFDKCFYRLGRGGGYYDRFLSSSPAFSVGLCREALLVPKVPREIHDRRVDCLVTEKKAARP